jgi:hypothetical protein
MNSVQLRSLVVAGFAMLAAPAIAEGPLAYAHDDATYPPDAPAAVMAGSETTGPGIALAHDDTTYPEGPVQVSTAVELVAAAPAGHDDATYPTADTVAPPAEVVSQRLAARASPTR